MFVCLIPYFLLSVSSLKFLLERRDASMFIFYIYHIFLAFNCSLSLAISSVFLDTCRDIFQPEYPACKSRPCICCFLSCSENGGRKHAGECEGEKMTHTGAFSQRLECASAVPHVPSSIRSSSPPHHPPKPTASWVPVKTLPERFPPCLCYLAEHT